MKSAQFMELSWPLLLLLQNATLYGTSELKFW